MTGPPGIGKSRLTREFLTAVGDGATVLAGRCLAYGEGTTYRALADIVRGLGDEPRRRVEELLAGDGPALRAIFGAVGWSDEPAQADETAWALRRLLETIARDGPLVVAVEDIHWAEPVLLDMLDHLVALSSGAPILLVCLTRPELLEARPAWAAPQPNRSVLVLGALPEGQARELAQALGADELAPRIAQRAEGNPLFLEQLVAVDSGEDTVELPASIQAVLTARIDRLQPRERTLLQRAAVVGRTFHAGTLALLLPEDERRAVASHLVALARKGLVSADRPEFAGEDAFRFTHALIREAAYAGVPKLLRADLHGRVADWLEQRPAAADEIVGYHLEQACALATALGQTGERERSLATRAAQRLRSASQAALARGDAAAASALLERAVALLGFDEAARGALLPALGGALYEAGRMTDATRVLDEAVARAPDERVQARAQVERQFLLLETETSVGIEQVRRVADDALVVLDREDDHHGRGRVWSLRAQAAWLAGRVGEADAAWRAGRRVRPASGRGARALRGDGLARDGFGVGPTPVDGGDRALRGVSRARRRQPGRSRVDGQPARLAACHEGRVRARRALPRPGQRDAARTRHPRRERLPSRGLRLARRGPLRARRAAAASGRRGAHRDERRAAAGDHDRDARPGGLCPGALRRGPRAVPQHRRGRGGRRHRHPGDLARRRGEGARPAGGARSRRGSSRASAVGVVAPTDLLSHHADAMLDLAEVLRVCSRASEASEAVRTGISLYEQKGNVVGTTRARRLLRH